MILATTTPRKYNCITILHFVCLGYQRLLYKSNSNNKWEIADRLDGTAIISSAGLADKNLPALDESWSYVAGSNPFTVNSFISVQSVGTATGAQAKAGNVILNVASELKCLHNKPLLS